MTGDCDRCETTDVEVVDYPNYDGDPFGKENRHQKLCDLCASVPYNSHDATVLAAICHVGNVILKRLPPEKK